MSRERQSFVRRAVIPVGTPAGVWICAQLMLSLFSGHPEWLGSAGLYGVLMTGASAVRFTLLLAGAAIVYPLMYVRGATLRERVLGSLTLPLVYSVWAMFHALAFFPPGEAIYYGLNPLATGAIFLQVGLMGMADIGCRYWERRRSGTAAPVFRWVQLPPIVFGLGALYVVLLWDRGVHWFYVYQEGYKLLFG